jgi:hypothetical protein
MTINYIALFCLVDDLYKIMIKDENKSKKSTRQSSLSIPEIITIILLFYQSNYKHFKRFYLEYVMIFHKNDFKSLSYSRFIQLESRILPYLIQILYFLMSKNQHTGLYYIDSTRIEVCRDNRISSHKVFESLAKIGKSSNDKWFLGFKLHVITNDKREIINILITQGNIDDREHVEDLSKDLKGRICGDRGYISKKLFEKLYSKGLKMITYLKNNMQNKLMEYRDKIMLRKRSSVIEGLFNILKNKFGLAHTRHRSVSGGFIHIISVLIAYMMS